MRHSQIQSQDDFDAYCGRPESKDSLIGQLKDSDRAYFRHALMFDSNGVLVSAYFGDLLELEGVDESSVAQLFESLFGVKREKFMARKHYFGDGQGNCNPRPHFYCGHGS